MLQRLEHRRQVAAHRLVLQRQLALLEPGVELCDRIARFGRAVFQRRMMPRFLERVVALGVEPGNREPERDAGGGQRDESSEWTCGSKTRRAEAPASALLL